MEEKRLALAVLCGGKSSRMGQPKEHLRVGTESFLERICRELSPFCEEKYLSVRKGQNIRYEGYTTLPDCREGIGPVSGICTVLKSVRADAVLCAACDMPCYSLDEARRIAAAWEKQHGTVRLMIPVAGDREQMLAAIYAKECLPALEEMIAKGIYQLRTLKERVPYRLYRSAEEAAYRNVNTEQDYLRFLHA